MNISSILKKLYFIILLDGNKEILGDFTLYFLRIGYLIILYSFFPQRPIDISILPIPPERPIHI
jgi:hypothetical protein